MTDARFESRRARIRISRVRTINAARHRYHHAAACARRREMHARVSARHVEFASFVESKVLCEHADGPAVSKARVAAAQPGAAAARGLVPLLDRLEAKRRELRLRGDAALLYLSQVIDWERRVIHLIEWAIEHHRTTPSQVTVE